MAVAAQAAFRGRSAAGQALRDAGCFRLLRLASKMDEYVAEVREEGGTFSVVVSHGRSTLAVLSAADRLAAEMLRDNAVYTLRETQRRLNLGR